MKIAGRMTKRPAAAHPAPAHWQQLRERALEASGHACRCCPASAAAGYALELHHRHYDTFGAEALEDVTVLCRQCHEAITSRLRAERPAKELSFVPDSSALPGRVVVDSARKNLAPLVGKELENVSDRLSVLPRFSARPVSAHYAQWAVGRSAQRFHEGAEVCLDKEKEDGR